MCEFANLIDKKLICSVNNLPCMYSRYCSKVNQYIHTDNFNDCQIIKDSLKTKIPPNSYYVRMINKGYLYVEYNGTVVKIKNTLGDLVKDYVYVKKSRGQFDISLTPF